MTMQEIMNQRSFAVVGDTLNEEKYAYKIKNSMIKNGYNVYPVGTEILSVNDIEADIDVIDLCTRAEKGLDILKACKKPFKAVVIQPGASSEELVRYLEENNIPYVHNCLLRALNEQGKEITP